MRRLLYSVILAAAVCACSRTPDGVIPPEQMAHLLADMHTGEAMIDMNRREYMADSSREAVKAAVYARYKVDDATFDSSLAWYGRNISVYMDVYDRTIEILEHRLIESGNRVAADASLSISGDSVDVWPYARYISVGDRSPSKILTFAFQRDDNWERGDSYTWRMKTFNNPGPSRWQMVTEYDDGTVEYTSMDFNGDGWKELIMCTDSLRQATRVYGYMSGVNRQGASLRIDSVQMVRKRVDPNLYGRRFTVRRIEQ